MEIKAQLLKPYTESQRIDFVVEYNHKQNLLIEETETALVAMGKTEEELAQKTQKELVEYNYAKKAQKAYGGILINETYLFETNGTSQSMITASLIGLQNAPDETTLNWKMYKDNQPIVVPLTKIQLAQLFNFAIDMINKSFEVEGVRNIELTTATVENLNNTVWVEEYKKATDLAFDAINNKIEVVLVQPSVEEEISGEQAS